MVESDRAAPNQEAEIERFLTTRGVPREAPPRPIDASIRPGQLSRGNAGIGEAETVAGGGARGPVRTAPFLPTITLGEAGEAGARGGPSADLLLRDILGEGGMGVVLLAEQRSLDRAVAIKRPLASTGHAALVEEARTMARVEHPNVVPVHALGCDAEGRPVLVMKRVLGASLKALLRDEEHPAWPRLVARWGDRERASLGILGEVADALGLAHARGIVHRDVKPENVMVGEFGEVYLLDWGIACPMTDLPDEALAIDDRNLGDIAGTPSYMAPEMVLAPGRVDARTDVYLLGATLHQVLTGTLRHPGGSLFQALVAVMESAPVDYPHEVPEDLAALANAATSRDPGRRPADAAAFRLALLEHERHRETLGLVRAARETLAPLADGTLAPTDPAAGPLLSEASAALAAAARAHPASAIVRAARTEQLRLQIERELALESPAAARASLALLGPESSELSAALEARVEALEATQARARASAEELSREKAEAEIATGMKLRLAVSLAAFIPILALATWLSVGELFGADAVSMRKIFTTSLAALALLGTGFWIFRARLLANRGNRQLSFFGLGGVAAVCASNLVGLALGQSPSEGLAHTHILLAAYFFAGGVLITRHLAWGTLTSCVAAALLVARPEWRVILSPLGVLAVILVATFALRAHLRER